MKLEGADAIQELQRVAQVLQEPAPATLEAWAGSTDGTLAARRRG